MFRVFVIAFIIFCHKFYIICSVSGKKTIKRKVHGIENIKLGGYDAGKL